jgi:hypothetical protein
MVQPYQEHFPLHLDKPYTYMLEAQERLTQVDLMEEEMLVMVAEAEAEHRTFG